MLAITSMQSFIGEDVSIVTHMGFQRIQMEKDQR